VAEDGTAKIEEKQPGSALVSTLRRMPLRTRLILAFVILIISSASATIMIGNAVFGRKFDELASDLVTLYVRLASHILDARLEKMRLVARNVSAQSARGADPLAVGELAGEEVPLDFILLYDRAGASILLRFPSSSGQGTARKPVERTLSPGSAAALLRNSLMPVFEKALKENALITGIAASPGSEIAALAGDSEGGERLLLIAAAPPAKPGGFGVLLGYVLNGRTDILEQAQRLIPSERKERLILSIYLGERRIASVKAEKAIHTDAESRVADTVLRRGEPPAGIATVHEENFYAAYVPLRDLSGRAIAMLGIGNSEDAVAEVRKRTILLFSSLIAGGMVFGFIMTFLFSSWLVSPISRLAEGMSRVADGDLNYKVRIESADELGKLAGAFNQTVRAVKERDLKLREMTDSRLTQVEKQISIGRLAAGVAHEINNPLTAILSLSSLWLKKMPADDPRRGDLEIVVSETSRCREIVRNLLDFARERPMEKRRINLNAIVRETLLLAKKYEAMTTVKVELKMCSFPLAVNADAKLLQQVFMNLLLNAAEATERGGSVRVETDEDSSGHFAQVKVADSGKGIRKEDINRVFEPFFTTKGAGKGTGLGLSVSLGIIQKHDGTVEIESTEGKGTTVTVLLPRAEETLP
jgi:two-component system NtrC family sensor kinase